MLYIGITAVVCLIFIAFSYNSVVSRKNQVENAFGSIDAMLKKRYNLIPNLVESVKAYMLYEGDTLTKITELRTRAESGKLSNEEEVSLNNELSTHMDKIKVTLENYPELKAGENFIQLQAAWNETEDNISASRRFYNSAVTDYNNVIEQFPTNIIARAISYKRKSVFEISETERKNLDAKTLFSK